MGIADKYVKGPVLGKGTFGEVIKGTEKGTGKVVAIKKVRIGEQGEGVNVTALREIKYLRELHHPNIVSLIDVLPLKKGVGLVFEYMESDLEAMIKDHTVILSPADIKAYMMMILQSLEYCHASWVVHRDIKPNNFLVAADGTIKLADFGLARIYGSPERRYTNQVFARWYRPPELLYGSTCYGPCVDIWAAGCVFAELLLRRPWFPGESDIDVLTKIFSALGTPTDPEWAGLRHMPSFVEFEATPAAPLQNLFPNIAHDALDLLASMMSLDPRRRITAEVALRHRYFKSEPMPTPKDMLPKPHPRDDTLDQKGAKGKGNGITDDDRGTKRQRLEDSNGDFFETSGLKQSLGAAFEKAA
jgi:cyclin-dependent kinase 7